MLVFGPESTKNEIKKDQPTEEIEEGKEQAAIAEEVKKQKPTQGIERKLKKCNGRKLHITIGKEESLRSAMGENYI